MKRNLSFYFALGIIFCGLLPGITSCSPDAENINNPDFSGAISGRVIFSNLSENENAGIIVTLDKTDGLTDTSFAASSVTLADGSYSFAGLEAGTYTIYAGSTYSAEKAVYTNVIVRSAETTFVESLKLTATGDVSGVVTLDSSYADNADNTGFLVFVAGTSYMAVTDAEGNYRISGIPAGQGYKIVVMKDGVIHNINADVSVSANNTTAMTDFIFSQSEDDTTQTPDNPQTPDNSAGKAPFHKYSGSWEPQIFTEYDAGCNVAVEDDALVITQTGDWYEVALCKNVQASDESLYFYINNKSDYFDFSDVYKITFEAKANVDNSMLSFSACTDRDKDEDFTLSKEWESFEYYNPLATYTVKDISGNNHTVRDDTPHYALVSFSGGSTEKDVHYIRNISFWDIHGNEIVPSPAK